MIVTGGSRGIGAATARLAAGRGYTVCVNYRRNRAAADEVVAGIAAAGGIAHFGFRLQDPNDIAAAARAVADAGGTVKEQGEFVPGEPYLFATDPDGYEIEIWFELPTAIDPPPAVQ